MLRLGVLLFAVGAGLAGCVSDQVGTDFASVSRKVGAPRAGQSRVVFLQDKRQGLSMAICACEVNLDGARSGRSSPENLPTPIVRPAVTKCW
jgi:hypothetical protein